MNPWTRTLSPSISLPVIKLILCRFALKYLFWKLGHVPVVKCLKYFMHMCWWFQRFILLIRRYSGDAAEGMRCRTANSFLSIVPRFSLSSFISVAFFSSIHCTLFRTFLCCSCTCWAFPLPLHQHSLPAFHAHAHPPSLAISNKSPHLCNCINGLFFSPNQCRPNLSPESLAIQFYSQYVPWTISLVFPLQILKLYSVSFNRE